MGFQISCLANVIVHTVPLRYTLTAHTRTYMRIFIRIYMRKKTRIHSHLMCLCYALINVKPEGGGTLGLCGAFDCFEEFLIKIPTLGSKIGTNRVKSPYPGDKLYRISEYLAVYLWILLHFRDINPLITVPAVTGRDFAHVRVLFLPPLEGHFLSPIVLIVFRMDWPIRIHCLRIYL